jgi:NADH-quinone oxidoreductase subunit C
VSSSSSSEHVNASTAPDAQSTSALVAQKLGAHLTSSTVNNGHAEVRVPVTELLNLCKILKLDSDLAMNFLVDITATDWMDAREERFELVYHFLSVRTLHRLRVKVLIAEEAAHAPSITSLWSGANFLEREVWDMYGIRFDGHPDLKRILMYEEFKGHPLRKDYPVQGKQPRIQLRHPEVENTARHMKRPELYSIRKRVDGQ